MANVEITVNKIDPNTMEIDLLNDELAEVLVLKGDCAMVWGVVDNFMLLNLIHFEENSYHEKRKTDDGCLYTWTVPGKQISIEVIKTI